MDKKPLVSVVIPTYNRKEKLSRLLHSIFKSDFPKDELEIIIVDDASTDGTFEEISQVFPQIKMIQNEKELFLAGSRNVGIKNAKGDYIFLIDDDNVVDRNCILELINVFRNSSTPHAGIAGPIMYYLNHPNRVWCAGIDRNMITSQTKFIGRDGIDIGQFSEFTDSKDFPNAFMIKNEVIKKVGLFDEGNFPIHYDEADFGERVRRAGYRIVCNPKAKVWHDIALPEEVNDKARLFHCHDEFRAYYCARNRVIFQRKYSKSWQFLIFLSVFNWLITLYYLKIILLEPRKQLRERIRTTESYLRGFVGLR